MKKTGLFAVKLSGIGAAAILFAASAFADSRHLDATGRADWRDDNRAASSHRDGGRGYERRNISVEGRITSISRERDGFRVQLDRGGYSFWTRDRGIGGGRRGFGRVSDLRVGVSIRIGGMYEPNYGYVLADDIACIDDNYGYRDDNYGDRDDDYGYRDGAYGVGVIRVIVDRVDDHRREILARDDRGRYVTIDMRRADHYRGIDVRDLRRGDRITLTGNWVRGDVFEAAHIESYAAGRY